MASAAAARPRLQALIAGDGELRADLEAYARQIGIADRVRFLGWRRDLATVYAATDVFLLTSRNEGTPVALIEAMASGIPGVSTDVGGVKDVIVSPDVGSRVGEPSGDALAAAVVHWLADATARHHAGTLARAAVVDRFSLDRLVDDIARALSRPAGGALALSFRLDAASHPPRSRADRARARGAFHQLSASRLATSPGAIRAATSSSAPRWRAAAASSRASRSRRSSSPK